MIFFMYNVQSFSPSCSKAICWIIISICWMLCFVLVLFWLLILSSIYIGEAVNTEYLNLFLIFLAVEWCGRQRQEFYDVSRSLKKSLEAWDITRNLDVKGVSDHFKWCKCRSETHTPDIWDITRNLDVKGVSDLSLDRWYIKTGISMKMLA